MTGAPEDYSSTQLRSVERAWERAASDLPVEGVGAEIRSSWQRSQAALVSPGLAKAPLLLTAEALASRRADSAWLTLARNILEPHLPLVRDSGHVLTLFGPDGAMLHSEGDPAVLERLREIHFMPGACWSEALVGTNGPGTALATGRPVHVVGPEHYCEAWQPWHCAAVPIRAPGTGAILGALDLSGYRDRADGFALGLATALARDLEVQLVLRHEARARRVLERYAEFAARHPNELSFAIDERGCVLSASPLARAGFDVDHLNLAVALCQPLGAPLGATGVPPALAGASIIQVKEGTAVIGACLVAPGRRLRSGSRPASPTRYTFADLVGQSAAFLEAQRLARAAVHNRLPVLIEGESGVGKELFAQAIHAAGPRAERPFVAVNCAALPAGLVESELFGYRGGAFSGAKAEGSAGKFEAAHQGTLFLDEVSELPLGAQASLLRVLQEQEVTPVGAQQSVSVDVRVIAATNRPLLAEVELGRLRLDLYHRLNVLAVEVPSLRDRADDLPALIEHFLASATAETGRRITLSGEVERRLAEHPWPGNIRELKNLLSRLAATSRGPVAVLDDLPRTMRPLVAPAVPLENEEIVRLKSAIDRSRTMAEAARLLGITRSTLYRQLDRVGLHRKSVVGPTS